MLGNVTRRELALFWQYLKFYLILSAKIWAFNLIGLIVVTGYYLFYSY
ncbi:hypothetical protein DOT_4489 [Desulfosporosinus sp. OT]|nr:hypothetical protein DOT_4489 [Desulfosporosinus sp. OT]